MTKKIDQTGPRNGLIRKLGPPRCRVSPKFTAILGCMLGEVWTDPHLSNLCITSDGFLLGEQAGDVGFNHMLGTLDELERNIVDVCRVAGASQTETGYLLARIATYRV